MIQLNITDSKVINMLNDVKRLLQESEKLTNQYTVGSRLNKSIGILESIIELSK